MTPLILILTLLAIAVIGAWGWMHHNRARKLAEERARVENERLAAEARLAHEKIAAEAKAREDARLQAEAEERSRKEAEAIENARLAEEQRLAAEKRAAEAEAKQQAEAEAREKARVEAEEAQRAEESRQAEEQARLEAEARDKVQLAAEEEARLREEEKAEQEKTESKPDGEAPSRPISPEVNKTPRPPPTKIAKPDGAGHIAPERRGGGQMETEENVQPTERRKRVRSGPQLRLICFKGNDRLWRLAVELPEDSSAGGDIAVRQNGQLLECTGFNENRWPVKRLDGAVEAAETRDGGQRWQLEIDSDECLLFKLLEDSETEEGRLVSAPSRGEYLVIAPADWPMPESSGIELVRERNVAIDGHVGYRFIVRDGVLPKLEFGRRGSQTEIIQFCIPFCFISTGSLRGASLARE